MKASPLALSCPGCLLEFEQHESHGICPECGLCWLPGDPVEPFVHINDREVTRKEAP